MRIVKLSLAAILLLAAGCSASPAAPLRAAAITLPPARFLPSEPLTIALEVRADAGTWCEEADGPDLAGAGLDDFGAPVQPVYGCFVQEADGAVRVVIADPCDPGFRNEAFARELCHEVGHVVGWRH